MVTIVYRTNNNYNEQQAKYEEHWKIIETVLRTLQTSTRERYIIPDSKGNNDNGKLLMSRSQLKK